MILSRRALLAGAAAVAMPARAEQPPLAVLPGDVVAPAFTLLDLAGTPHSLADYRGHPLLVSFWAVWCAPCRRELGTVAKLRTHLAGSGVAVVAVNLGDSRDRVVDFLADHPAPGLPILLDADRSVATAWHVPALPVAFAVTGHGVLRLGALGEQDWLAPQVEAQLRALR
jgi:peroxiredoxin